MAWIRVDEPFAAPPKHISPRAVTDWSGGLEPDRGLVELMSVNIDEATLDLDDADELLIDDSVVTGTVFGPGPEQGVHITGSRLDRCDLSQARIAGLRQTTITGTKFVGTDFSGAHIKDVTFTGCSLRIANFRMATLTRVEFTDCEIDELDAFEATLEDVSLGDSRVTALNIDRVTATRVDVRACAPLELRSINRLDGFLVDETQLPALAPQLAAAVGLDIEQREG